MIIALLSLSSLEFSSITPVYFFLIIASYFWRFAIPYNYFFSRMFYSLSLLFYWSIGFSQFPFFCRKELSESISSSAFVGPVCSSSSKLPLKSIDMSLRTFSVVLLFSIGKSSSSKMFKHCLLLLSIFDVLGFVFVEDFFKFILSEIFTFFLSLGCWLYLLLLIEVKELAEWSFFKLWWSKLTFALPILGDVSIIFILFWEVTLGSLSEFEIWQQKMSFEVFDGKTTTQKEDRNFPLTLMELEKNCRN